MSVMKNKNKRKNLKKERNKTEKTGWNKGKRFGQVGERRGVENISLKK